MGMAGEMGGENRGRRVGDLSCPSPMVKSYACQSPVVLKGWWHFHLACDGGATGERAGGFQSRGA